MARMTSSPCGAKTPEIDVTAPTRMGSLSAAWTAAMPRVHAATAVATSERLMELDFMRLSPFGDVRLQCASEVLRSCQDPPFHWPRHGLSQRRNSGRLSESPARG